MTAITPKQYSANAIWLASQLLAGPRPKRAVEEAAAVRGMSHQDLWAAHLEVDANEGDGFIGMSASDVAYWQERFTREAKARAAAPKPRTAAQRPAEVDPKLHPMYLFSEHRRAIEDQNRRDHAAARAAEETAKSKPVARQIDIQEIFRQRRRQAGHL